MSRYTRWLRKKSRAKALEQGENPDCSGGVAVQEAAEPIPRRDLSGHLAADTVQKDLCAPERVAANPPVETTRVIPPAQIPAGKLAATPTEEGRPGVGSGRDSALEIGPGQPRPSAAERWLWHDKILLGDLVVVVGEESSGKTRVLTDWIARVTVGQPFPGVPVPANALPPSDVLVFNSVDDFDEAVLQQVARNGGDPRRVLQASTQLLDWGYSHHEFPRGQLPQPEIAGGEAPETRVRLHTREVLSRLRQFLLRRPSLRLVVIDQLKQHLRTDSERVFEDLVFDLQALARETGVVLVLTQRPDAFRNAIGIKQYFKSDSLISVARSIWRVAKPDDPTHGHRVLECLKLGYGYNDSGKEPWRLWQNPGQPMRWEVGTGQEFPLGKLDAKHRILFHAKSYIALYLQMFGGLADFETLRFWARKEGITGAKLFEASIAYNFGYEFEACSDNEIGLRKVIGSWEEIRKRRAIPEADRPPVFGPPLPKRRKRPQAPVPATVPVDFSATVPPDVIATVPVDAIATVPVDASAASPTDSPLEIPSPVSVRPPHNPLPGSGTATPAPRSTPAQVVESLRARVARGEARLKEFNLEGFRFIKPNLATCHLLLNLEAEFGSEDAMVEHMRKGLEEIGMYSTEDLQSFLAEYRRLFRIARQVEAGHARPAAA